MSFLSGLARLAGYEEKLPGFYGSDAEAARFLVGQEWCISMTMPAYKLWAPADRLEYGKTVMALQKLNMFKNPYKTPDGKPFFLVNEQDGARIEQITRQRLNIIETAKPEAARPAACLSLVSETD